MDDIDLVEQASLFALPVDGGAAQLVQHAVASAAERVPPPENDTTTNSPSLLSGPGARLEKR